MNKIAQLTDLFSAEDGLNFNTGRAARMASAGKKASKPPHVREESSGASSSEEGAPSLGAGKVSRLMGAGNDRDKDNVSLPD